MEHAVEVPFRSLAVEKQPLRRRRLTDDEVRRVYSSMNGVCYLCRGELPSINERTKWHIEHIFPYSKYPQRDSIGNLLPAHATCNRKKSNKFLPVFLDDNPEYTVVTAAFDVTHLDAEVVQHLVFAKASKHK